VRINVEFEIIMHEKAGEKVEHMAVALLLAVLSTRR
jgi:hypothetical protein